MSDKFLKPFHFSTEGLNAEDRLEASRQFLSPLAEVTSQKAGDLVADTWVMGGIVLCRLKSPDGHLRRTDRQIRNAWIDHYMIHAPYKGQFCFPPFDERIDGPFAKDRPRTIGLHSLITPCEGDVINSDSLLVLLPRDSVGRFAPKLDSAIARGFEGGALGSILYTYLRHVEERLPLFTEKEGVGVAASIVDLVTALCGEDQDSVSRLDDVIRKSVKAQIRELVHSEIANTELSSAYISHAMGISRSKLYRLFEGEAGVANYIERARLRKALAALEDPVEGRALKKVAVDCGFRDVTELQRLFRKHVDADPGEINRSSDRSDLDTALMLAERHFSDSWRNFQ